MQCIHGCSTWWKKCIYILADKVCLRIKSFTLNNFTPLFLMGTTSPTLDSSTLGEKLSMTDLAHCFSNAPLVSPLPLYDSVVNPILWPQGSKGFQKKLLAPEVLQFIEAYSVYISLKP